MPWDAHVKFWQASQDSIIIACGAEEMPLTELWLLDVGFHHLRPFAKLPKATISFGHVCSSVRMEQHDYHWMDFHKIYLGNFRKTVKKIQVSLISDKKNEYFTWRAICIYDRV